MRLARSSMRRSGPALFHDCKEFVGGDLLVAVFVGPFEKCLDPFGGTVGDFVGADLAVFVLVANLLVDLSYSKLDPRVSYAH